jgi:hypothetical protein
MKVKKRRSHAARDVAQHSCFVFQQSLSSHKLPRLFYIPSAGGSGIEFLDNLEMLGSIAVAADH